MQYIIGAEGHGLFIGNHNWFLKAYRVRLKGTKVCKKSRKGRQEKEQRQARIGAKEGKNRSKGRQEKEQR